MFHIGTTATNTVTIGDSSSTANAATSGQILASSIIKDGPGVLALSAEQGTFAGAIALNGGTLTLNNETASNANASNAGGKGGTIYLNGYNSTLNLNAGSAAAGGSFNNNVYLAVGNPEVTIAVNRVGATSGQTILGGVGTGAIAGTGNLTFGGASGDEGQTLDRQPGQHNARPSVSTAAPSWARMAISRS